MYKDESERVDLILQWLERARVQPCSSLEDLGKTVKSTKQCKVNFRHLVGEVTIKKEDVLYALSKSSDKMIAVILRTLQVKSEERMRARKLSQDLIQALTEKYPDFNAENSYVEFRDGKMYADVRLFKDNITNGVTIEGRTIVSIMRKLKSEYLESYHHDLDQV